ncbi:tRNA pseudouridine(13) synthase TruD [Archangium violaceum]|uniref:tRNA pseudouridine(13) synthase TruD n=1 Tax=Archangium violaceum TaxID=83451 RepID=UPI00194ED7B2|nr:tRNA pseudouridine(13) synthase TruD [Archangium violaceum]QRN93053.1 tRNA pseudouridine(13) synthase TruD [Archangium violaceum]
MRIKQRPEDFSVKESYRFDEVPSGRYRVYLMDKQKLSTFDAADRIRDAFGLKPGSISYCGLKDKQGRTEQLIAVDGADVDMQEPDLRLKYLGRSDKALSAANITSNRFAVTVRSLSETSVGFLNVAAAEVNRLGVVNYFDSQRFGSLKHGQGFIAKDLIRGDFEAALRNYLAKPSELDRTEDAKVKSFWRDNWGRWDARVPFEGSKKYHRILKSLREHPGDYLRAFLQIDASYRAMLLFTYQSYLWNEGVRRYLQLLLPREHLFPLKYQAGTLLFYRDADPEVLRVLRESTFPLLAPDTRIEDPKVKEAVDWVLGREKLSLEDLRIKEAPRMLYFKHEERPTVVLPHKLVIGRVQNDELNRGEYKVNIAFTLPPGAYATLVIKRLFHFEYQEESAQQIRDSWRAPVEDQDGEAADTAYAPRGPRKAPAPTPPLRDASRGGSVPKGAPGARGTARRSPAPEAPTAPDKRVRTRETTEARPTPTLGFRESQRQKKDAKEKARREQAAKRPESRKKK